MFKGKRKGKGTIKRIDHFRSLSQKEFGYMLCWLLDQADVPCEECPMRSRCDWRHNGFVEWLGDDLRL